LLLIAASVVSIIWQAGIASKERDNAKLETLKAEQINKFLNDMLSSAGPEKSGKDVKVVDVLEEASKKISSELNNQPEIEAELRTTLGITYQGLGLYDEGITQLSRAFKLRDSLYGENNVKTGKSIKNLALIFHYKGDMDTAKYLYEKSIKILRGLNIKNSPELSEALNDYGTFQQDLHLFPESEASFKEALKMNRVIYGKEHREISSILNNLALSYHYRKDYESAEKYYKEALEMNKKLFGDSTINVTYNLNNLAFVMEQKGDLIAAESLFTEAYDIRKKILGDNHPELALTKYNLGCLFFDLKKYDKAEKYITEAIDIWKGKLSSDHYYFGNAYSWLGRVQNHKKQYDKAFQNLNKALAIRRKMYAEDSELIINTETELGRCLFLQKRFEESEKILLSNFKKIKKKENFNERVPKYLIEAIIDLYNNWGKKDEAKKYSALLPT
ncbi:MAG: tetratricopeptide repeat protein, partial [Ignavibacteriaceae bacterium]